MVQRFSFKEMDEPDDAWQFYPERDERAAFALLIQLLWNLIEHHVNAK